MSDNEDVFENEAQQEEQDKFDDSSEEEEDQDNFEEDDFIVDDVGDGEEDGGVGPLLVRSDDDGDDLIELKKKKKKKRRRYDDSHELAEGDLELLEEKGVRIDRKKKLRRLRKGASDEEDNVELDDDVRDLADIDDDDLYNERRRQADEPLDYDDELDDFIDDGGRRRRRRAAERDGLVSSEAVRQARSIFGDVEEMTQYRGVDKLFQKGQDGEEEEDVDYVGEEEEERRPLRTIRDRETDKFDDIEAMPAEPSQSQGETIAMQLSGPTDNVEAAKHVVEMDVPEQLQYHFGPNHRTPTDAQLKEEGTWIYNHGFRDNPMFQDYEHYKPEAVTNRIVVVLSYIHIDKLDIPFIAMYRKDYITPFLIPRAGEVLRDRPSEADFENRGAMRTPRGFNSYKYEDYKPGVSIDHLMGVPRGYDDGFGDWSVLWHILDLDKKYASMLRKRQELLDAAKVAAEKGVPALVVEDVTTIVQTCQEERRLKDAEAYLHLAVELADVSKGNNILSDFMEDNDDENRTRRPSRRKNRYADFCKRGYRALAEEFGLSARQFGENFRGANEYGSEMQMHVPLDADDEPLEVARVCADRLGESAERAGITEQKLAERMLSAARLILVTEIVADMQVIQTAREILCKPGTVSITTIPTRQGIAQVDDTHPLRSVTCLVEKQLESFTNTADFALVMRAVNLGFTNLQVVLQPEQIATFENLLQTSFLVSGVKSLMVEKWNEERMLVVEEVRKILVNQFIEEVTDELTSQTHSVLRHRLSQAASRRFMLGPGRPNPADDGCPRVLAVCVTGEEDEEPDPLQVAKDAEDAKGKGQMGSEKRIARERLTFVELDENGEYQTGYELFAGWLRRPMRSDLPDSKLSKPIKDQLKAFISQSRAQIITIGIGSGGRSGMRLHTDLMDIVTEMVCSSNDEDDRPRRPLMLNPRDMEAIQKLNAEKDSREKAGDRREAEDSLKALRQVLSRYVVLVDEFPARIYARTEAANIGLSVDAMTFLEKRAIALGRLAQEPLWIYTAIGQDQDTALHFKIHPYHYFVQPHDRLMALQRALFRAVCANGVDINRMLRLPHTQSMLAFVGGLGVHKSKALLRALESSLTEDDRGLQSRKHLWSENYLGRIVFLSTAAFLRVRDPELHPGGSTRRAVEVRRARLNRTSRGRRRDDDGNTLFDPMDDSRIHPEHYSVAIKIADEALRDDDGELHVNIAKSEEYSEALRMTSAVLDQPDGLQRLALDEYADHLEKLGRGSLFETVKIIASEFQGPYRDHRQALCSPEPPAVFYLVTGADPMMMRIGTAVAATNCHLREKRRPEPDQRNIFGVTCSLPNNIRGYLPLFPQSQFTDDDHLSDEELKKLLPDGCSLRCRITDFNYVRFEAILTSRGSAVDNPENIPGYVPLVDKNDPAYRPYPILDPQEPNGNRLLLLKPSEKPEIPSNPKLKRTTKNLRQNAKPVVHHPYFREVTGDDAILLLKSALPGDIIIRPSQYDKDGIIFSCKFATLTDMDTESNPRGVFHKDCQMEYDPSNTVVPLRLKLDDVIYEHVDQVLEQYLRPIISNLAECLEHRKFKSGSTRQLEDFVSDEKKRAPKSIPYCFGLSEKNLTSLTLVYIPGTTTAQQEEIKVVPDGYRLRAVLHKNMNVLFTWFKKNMRKGTGRRPSGKDPVGASPFQSAYASVASPYRAAASPFHGARSPFAAPSSPFVGGATVRPAQDVPPPPAPLAASNVPDPYRALEEQPPSRMAYPSTNDRNPIAADVWAKATLQRDEPPPSSGQNGNYGMAPPPPRSPPPRSPPPRYSDDMRGNGRGPPPQGPLPRGPPPRVPPPRGPPPRRPPGGGDGNMPTWRGAKPVPAWKKAQEQQGE